MTETALPHVLPRRNRRVFVLLGLLLLLLAYTGMDLWAGHRVNAEIARLETQYGSLDVDSMRVAAVPAADNRARVVTAAAALTVSSSGATYGDFRTSLSRFDRLTKPAPVPDDLRAFVEANRNAIHLAGETRARRRSNFEVYYPSGSNHPAFVEMQTLSSAIYLAALIDLEAGQADDALTKVTSGLAVSASLRQEQGLIAQLIRIAVASPQFQAVRRVISGAEPSKAALEECARWLAETREQDPMRVGLLGELKQANAQFTKMERGRAVAMDGAYGLLRDAPPWFGALTWVGRPFVRLAHVRYLRRMGLLLEAQAGPRPLPAFPESPTPGRFELIDRLVHAFAGGIERYILMGDDFDSELGATEVAVALRRFRLDHGAYPDDPSALVPAYLPRLPLDPYTGQPPVYARQGAGFTLHTQRSLNYSPGPNDWAVPK